jgi:hypothetical protein
MTLTNPFSENVFYPHQLTDIMEPPQTKKQQIKNQKRKGLSEHRLGSAKHVRLAVSTQQKRIPK